MADKTTPLNLMAKRLGVYYRDPTVTSEDYKDSLRDERSLMAHRLSLLYNSQSVNTALLDKDSINTESDTKNFLEGIDNQSTLLDFNGGHAQQARMIRDKRRTLDRVLIHSYQGADVKLVNADTDDLPVRALINPNKLKQDYDDKVISIGYEYGYGPGDIFKWVGTNTYWLIYLQDLTELAYFRGDIRKCSYHIKWEDEDGNLKSTFAAVRGPVETKIKTTTVNGNQHDFPNYSLNLLLPKTEDTLKQFRRYSKFYLRDQDPGAPEVCWRVEAVDWISMPGVLGVTAVEYYINEDEDDIEEGLVGKKAHAEVIEPDAGEINPDLGMIEGDTFIKPKKTFTFTFKGDNAPSSAKFIIDSKYPITVVSEENGVLKLKWNASYSGQFTINYGYESVTQDPYTGKDISTTHLLANEKIVVVESLW